jgi:predicted dehydrogenase
MNTVRWGIVGTGRMAATFAGEFARLGSHGIELSAVASRHIDTARAFAARHRIATACDSVAKLAARQELDAVYIATPHVRHCEDMLTCLERGKAVLCEKPFTLNAPEAERVIATAKARGCFAMEAMWTRFLPSMVALRERLAGGSLGTVRMVVGGGAFVPDFDEQHYLFNTGLGGGVLLDAGVYLVSMASMIMGTPRRALACGAINRAGIDEQDAILLEHDSGACALLYVSMRARRAPDMEILFDAGRVRIEAPVFRPTRLTYWDQHGVERVEEHPLLGTGYAYQLLEASAALRAGRTESDIMPLAETLTIMKTMDQVREQIGLRYESEAKIDEDVRCQSY